MNAEARRLIATFDLAPLPHEGGFFRQTWRSATSSAIYFLLTPDDFSALHRLNGEEVWHFYAGDSVDHVQLDPREKETTALRRTRLGPNGLAGETPQLVVPAGVWQGARLASPPRAGWSLLGCTMAPPWDENGFELGGRAELLRAFPSAAAIVHALTR